MNTFNYIITATILDELNCLAYNHLFKANVFVLQRSYNDTPGMFKIRTFQTYEEAKTFMMNHMGVRNFTEFAGPLEVRLLSNFIKGENNNEST